MKFKIVTLFFLSICIAPWSQAAVTPVTLILGNTAIDYTIPVGKVLVIEHAMASNSGGSLTLRRQFILDNGPRTLQTLDFVLKSAYTDGTVYTLERPLKIKGGKLQRNPTPAGNNLYLIGLLVDESDLFAAVPNTIEDANVSAGVLAATVRPSSARPARAVVEQSTDGLTYAADSSATVTRTGSGAADLSVTTSTDEPLKSIRVDLRARPSE